MQKQVVLFCDFDGTITEKDNIIAIMREFALPGWEELTDQILGQQISIREGVGKLFATIPSHRKQDIVDFLLREARIRAGFAEFIQYCKKQDITLLITSGGIDFFVYPMLAPYGLDEHIYCNGSDFSQDTITITWPHACDEHCTTDCGMCKTAIIRQYDPSTHYRIVIGDSITDLAGAKIADFVIARSLLETKCNELQLPYRPFSTFFDVIDALEQITNGQEVR
ncbi:2-hydroxy-3-keto-5-methylthiopentenyl-1-phosphate phosphatase [Brevibacillus sp. SYSU BS000544]|uniref:2-hydroxy-3-keto-5-methylthiopentenyl-1- phosphate phosphatase n=1 Tax=Brevibacillus sp. SYSU BS000544 TaxID=3416443 RepID=UPI003CE4DA43